MNYDAPLCSNASPDVSCLLDLHSATSCQVTMNRNLKLEAINQGLRLWTITGSFIYIYIGPFIWTIYLDHNINRSTGRQGEHHNARSLGTGQKQHNQPVTLWRQVMCGQQEVKNSSSSCSKDQQSGTKTDGVFNNKTWD